MSRYISETLQDMDIITMEGSYVIYIYNFIRHVGSHIQYKKAIYSKQNDEKVNNSVTIFQQHIRVGHITLAESYRIFNDTPEWPITTAPLQITPIFYMLHRLRPFLSS